jgi:predicted nucleic acid-binding protein
MAKTPLIYWDACAWLGLLNKEAAKHRELDIMWQRGRRGEVRILTSALSMVEVFKKKCEGLDAKPLTDETEAEIAALFEEDHVVRVQLEPNVATQARKLLREHLELKKAPDAIHLATALWWNCDEMQTYDHDNLIGLSGKIPRRDGLLLTICMPDATTDGPLFAPQKDLSEKGPTEPA